MENIDGEKTKLENTTAEVGNINPKDLELLTEINKEKFKRRIALFRSVSTRIIALLLVLAIVYVGFIQLNYAKEVASIKEKYGSLGYCYLCGKETLRQCSCIYQAYDSSFDIINFSNNLAESNAEKCEPFREDVNNNRNYLLEFNFTK